MFKNDLLFSYFAPIHVTQMCVVEQKRWDCDFPTGHELRHVLSSQHHSLLHEMMSMSEIYFVSALYGRQPMAES